MFSNRYGTNEELIADHTINDNELTVYNVPYIPTEEFPVIWPIITLSDTLNTCVANVFPISGILSFRENSQ